jgi:uncharacterized DUF497 family protein
MIYEFEDLEWYPPKRAVAKQGRHLDFADAQIVFDDGSAVTFRTDRNGELRYKTTGMMPDGKLYTVVHTPRNGNCRVMSMRRAHKNEEEAYYETRKI